ncbi:copper chaperone PCu(A)C [Pseudoalteromonas sp. KG3]|uniref:copper chaperone PCu(A)C n=1 Tax=Pseudoalteromonas TaxID=53246 RepID=UPI0026584853|nr:copper chaperone PCu(A)C [Pseudoalteromonas sp. KG3]WKD22880.1 copper chaperone PCu(A)C [Pseudoalteromonas sp. KG3]
MSFKSLLTMLTPAILAMGLYSSALLAHADHQHDTVNEIVVNNAQIRDFLPGSKSSAGYLTLVNHGDTAIELTKVTVESLGRVEIHEHQHVNGMMKMQKVDTLQIKAHQQLDFKPGGYHLMVFEPKEPLKIGQELKLTLYFSNGDRVFTQASVVSLESQIAETPQSQQHHTHH